MAIKKFSPLLADNPLCGIGEYKDVLDLSTGGVTRRIKKQVLTANQQWTLYNGNYYSSVTDNYSLQNMPCRCTHTAGGILIDNGYVRLKVLASQFTSVASNLEEWKVYLQQQYDAGHPVTIWYVLATPWTETITVPSGLTGTIEGYLTQSGTPTPSKPIYPEANPALTWVPTTYRKYGTETDVITALPAQIIGDGQPITSCQISGNTVQNGTPTPEAPVDVVGCGVRTGNLFSSIWEQGSIDGTTGQNINSIQIVRTENYIPIKPNIVYSFSRNQSNSFMNLRLYRADGSYIGPGSNSTIRLISGTSAGNPMGGGVSFCCFEVIDSEAAYIRFCDASNSTVTKWHIVEGEYTQQTMPKYEPYGYKLPLTVNGTEHPIYLGQVPTTRRIKKYEFTGQESDLIIQGVITATNAIQLPVTLSDYKREPFNCSHMQVTGSPGGSSTHGYYGQILTLCFAFSMGLDTLEKVRTYLAQQYAAGTPVTVWYVSDSARTGIVNEPLMKIGDYADTVSITNIPTTGTAEQFDIQTTLKPSEVQLTYHGWHEHDDTKYTQGE